MDLAETLKHKEEALKHKEKELEQLRAELDVLREAQRICMMSAGSTAPTAEIVRPQPPGPEPVAAAPKPQVAVRRFP